jgi:uncharacterized membrane protein
VILTSWVDVGGTVLLWMAGLYHLGSAHARVRRGSGRYRDDVGALLASLLGAMVFAMGVLLLAYSIGFAAISEGLLSR